ncbi:hypothetical protein HZB04_01530 [Candidatus Wolfebacteria bacterium]|nr:hypothetical protein [Candidatus Wolfebacteria bacterium]
MDLRLIIKSILNILNPQPKTGALEINDIDLKFTRIENNRLVSYSAKLANDAVKEGKINNQKSFSESLSNLYSQIAGDKKNKKEEIYVIVNIPDNNIYLQTFNLPAVSEKELDEAAKLNLKMVSPIDFENTYANWQLINKPQKEEIKENRGIGQFEILGAFIQSRLIDEFDDSLRQNGFIPIAVEFNALALTKLAIDLGIEIDSKKPFILIYFGNNGLSFNLIRNGNLYFNHFIPWQLFYAENGKIPVESFKKLVIEEFKKVLSFYAPRWQEPINEVVLTAYGLEENIIKIISENFSFKIKPLMLKKFQNVSSNWFPAIGSALRGEIPWSQDYAISIAKFDAKEKLFQYKLKKFIEIWRNIFIVSSSLILIIFIGADVFLRKTTDNMEYQLSTTVKRPQEEQEKKQLMEKIIVINKKIELANMAFKKKTTIFPFLEKIKNFSSENNISLKRIFVQSWTTPIFINAFAPTSEIALNFRNKLANYGGFENVDLPITKIIPGDGGVNFMISFKIKNNL